MCKTMNVGVVVLMVCLLSQTAKAAVVEVDVTIKSVDSRARGITVVYETKLGQKSIDLDVSRKAEITVNGKPGMLDSVKPGQKAKVVFEKELQVVTKIDATGEGTAPGREVYRFLLSVSEFGDCTLKIEQTTTPISSATKFDGKPMKLPRFPNAELWKASDGRYSIIQSFDHSDPLAAVFGAIHHVEADTSTGTIAFMPQKDDTATVMYWSFVQLPAVLCYDRLPIGDDSGIVLHLNIGSPVTGALGINFGRGKDGKTFTGVFWNDVKDGLMRNRTQILGPMPFDIAEGCERTFRLPLPNIRITDVCPLWLVGWSDTGTKSEVVRLLVQGRLHPMLGIDLAERMGVVFAQSVNRGGIAEKAGFKTGDVVLSINGQQPKSKDDAMSLCRKLSIGDKIQIKIRRGDEERELKITTE
jgi:hypothetical protein